MPRLRLVVALGLAPAAACGGDGAPAVDGRAVVVDVVDGDTIVVDVAGREEHARLIGIDTPEVHVDAGEQPDCYGPEASAFLEELLPAGTVVRLERDVVGRDDYGRLLVYVYRAADRQMVNEAIIAAGFATPLSIAPNAAFAPRFVAAARAAEAAGLGLWGACAG